MKIIKFTLLIYIACFCGLTDASFKVFEAPLEESKWQYKGNLLSCQLNHTVPYYGDAIFSQQAGSKQALKFKMSYKRQPITSVKVASIQSLSPSWLPKQRARDLGETTIHRGHQIFQALDIGSWKLLNELEVGRFPTFRYQDFDSIQDQVAVSLSSVGFKHPYDQFLNCLTGLVPYNLEQLTKMTLHFDFDKHSVKNKYRQKLKALAAYLRYDSDLEIVFVSGYTDSKGSRGYNHKLAQRRIASVQKLLTLEGTDTAKFKTLAHGERNPVASNRRATGRAKNRRVYIRVSHN